MTQKPDPGWELYRSFLATLRSGSLSGAARALGLTQPTIGRHISELEAALGTALFTRSGQGLLPTDAAHELAPYAETMAAAAAALVRTASAPSHELRGTVRISASEVIAIEVLPPMLTDLRNAHTELAFELVASNEITDLLRRDVDIAIRNVRPTQSGLVARKIGAIPLGLHAHESYLAAHGKPTRLEDLSRHALIGFDKETAAVRALQAKGMAFTREMFALRTDSHLAHLAAIRSGYGIGICQVPIAQRHPGGVRRMRAVFDHLAEALTRYARPKSDKSQRNR